MAASVWNKISPIANTLEKGRFRFSPGAELGRTSS
jgi:hypothetical protein